METNGFGILLAVGGLLALALATVQMHKAGLKTGTASWFALLSIPLGLVLARVGYCLCVLDFIMSMDDWGLILRLEEGGLLPYGLLFGGLIAAWLTGKITGQSGAVIADCAAVPGCVAILFWRLGEGLIGQGRGMDLATWFDPEVGNSLFHPAAPTFFERFPFAMRDYYGEWSWAVYILEALCAVAIAIALLRMKKTAPGGRAALMWLLYAVTQVLCESMRRGDVLRWGFVRINQVIGAVVILCVLFTASRALPAATRRRQTAAAFVQVLLGAIIVMAMEFALEKKITVIEFVPSDVCYVIMAAACAWMALAVRPAWRARWQHQPAPAE